MSESIPSISSDHQTEGLQIRLLSTYDTLLFSASNPAPVTQQQLKESRQALSIIRSLLVGATLGGDLKQDGQSFIALQVHVELNATAVLLRWIALVSTTILKQIQTVSNEMEDERIPQLVSAITIMQGLLHLHRPSQRLFASRFNLQILLDFLLPSLEAAALQALAVPLLDLLLIAFIDSPINKQLFESSGGLEILIKAMKNKHIRKDVRVKVLETVWGWWIEDDDEKEPTETVPTGHSKAIDLPPGSAPLQPNLTSASTPMRKQSTPSSTSFGSSTPVAVQFHTSALSKQSVSSGRKAPDHDRPGRSTSREERSSATPGNSRLRPISLPPPSEAYVTEETTNEQTPRASTNARPRNMSLGIVTPMSPLPRLDRYAFPPQADSALSSPLVKSSSAHSSASSGGSRPERSGDPTMRLRQMLENTASDFVPATPRHPRVKSSTRRDLIAPTSSSTPRHGLHRSQPARRLSCQLSSGSEDIPEETDEEEQDRRDATPTKLFISKNRRTAAQQGGNTPQRMLRHKQSASLSSIQHQLSSPLSGVISENDKRVVKEKPARQDPFSGASSDESEKHRGRTDVALRPPSPIVSAGLGARHNHSSHSSSDNSPPRSGHGRASSPAARPARAAKVLRPSGLSGGAIGPSNPASSGINRRQSMRSAQRDPPSSRRKETTQGVTFPVAPPTIVRPAIQNEARSRPRPRTPSIINGAASPSTPSSRSRPVTPSNVSKSLKPSGLAHVPLTPSNKLNTPHGMTPMRSAAGKAMATSMGWTPASSAKPEPSPRKTFLTRPTTPQVNGLINPSDVEMMINGTDTDDAGGEWAAEGDEDDENAGEGSIIINHTPKLGTSPSRRTLDKYMGNSDQLLKRFEEMKLGLNVMMYSHQSPQRSKS